jgi:glycosyltransferase involved in cell wall biosynthesis
LKILFVSETTPEPPNGGERIRVSLLLRLLTEFAEVHFVYVDPLGEGTEEGHCEVPAGVESGEVLRAGPPRIRRLRLTSSKVKAIGSVARTLRAICTRVDPDVVWYDFGYGAHYRPAFAGRPCVFGTHNVLSEFEASWASAADGHVKGAYRRMNWLAARYHEKRYMPRWDRVVCVSERDAAAYRRMLGRDTVRVIPNFVEVPCERPRCVTQSERPRALFIGNMGAFQNRRAADFLVRRAWPLVARRLPGAELVIAGKGAPAAWRSEAPPGVKVLGEVADAAALLRECSVSLVPILDGSGTRFKILDSMAAGTPVVSTSKGAEGLDVRPGRDILIADSPEAFARETAELLESPVRRQEIAAEAFALVTERYSMAAARPLVRSLIDELVVGR